MATTAQRPKLVAIVGPTASGKSELAVKLAKEFNGEIIAADSRTVYKDMNIGTAKPSSQDQKKVPHHLLDMVKPSEPFTAADFQKEAKKVIAEIQKRGHLPLLVGGSGLYVDSLIFNFKFAPKADPKLHSMLAAMDIAELKKYATDHDIFLGGIGRNNKRHLVRAIERGGMVKQKLRLRSRTLVVGIMPPPAILKERIILRAQAMIDNGFVNEARQLTKSYGWESEPNTVYKAVYDYDNNALTLEELKKRLIKGHIDLAKRQKTWFKRNKFIKWFDSSEQAYSYIKMQLNN